jgi:drug/metabolite transporter (DMT)-like permease
VIARAYAVTAVALAVGLFPLHRRLGRQPRRRSRAVALVGWGQLLTAVMLAAYALVLFVSADRP